MFDRSFFDRTFSVYAAIARVPGLFSIADRVSALQKVIRPSVLQYAKRVVTMTCAERPGL